MKQLKEFTTIPASLCHLYRYPKTFPFCTQHLHSSNFEGPDEEPHLVGGYVSLRRITPEVLNNHVIGFHPLPHVRRSIQIPNHIFRVGIDDDDILQRVCQSLEELELVGELLCPRGAVQEYEIAFGLVPLLIYESGN